MRPDSVPPLTVEAANKDAAAKDNDDTDSDQSYRYCALLTPMVFLHFSTQRQLLNFRGGAIHT